MLKSGLFHSSKCAVFLAFTGLGVFRKSNTQPKLIKKGLPDQYHTTSPQIKQAGGSRLHKTSTVPQVARCRYAVERFHARLRSVLNRTVTNSSGSKKWPASTLSGVPCPLLQVSRCAECRESAPRARHTFRTIAVAASCGRTMRFCRPSTAAAQAPAHLKIVIGCQG